MSNLVSQKILDECIRFAQRLIQTPSMPGKEGDVAALAVSEMDGLGFDKTWIDAAGNVNGMIVGRDHTLGSLVLNSHLDHVDPGDLALWPYPPYAAKITGDRIFGRGACDIKGPLAVQIYSMAYLLALGERPRRNLIFSGVVEEEVGGAGAVHWVNNLDYPVDLIVLGEPSSNNLSLGHRGILQIWVKFTGRSVHASVPSSGTNPNFALADFLCRINERAFTLSSHPIFGNTTVAPTIVEVDTTSMNVTPAWSRVLLDFRTASESTNSLQSFVLSLTGEHKVLISDAWSAKPDTPIHSSDEIIVGFETPADHPQVERVLELITQGVGERPNLVGYNFATDGRHFSQLGAPIVGYSPGEENLAHTVDESISISMMAASLNGHLSLLRNF